MSLTLNMIVKNEEAKLSRCLNSVAGLTDQIVIIDTGSTDRTIEIAEEHGATVYKYKWRNDFSDARNFALSKCGTDWVLYLDADEWLDAESGESLKTITAGRDYKGINCLILNYSQSDKDTIAAKYPRLFPLLPEIKFTGKAHEQIEPSIRKAGLELADSDIIIHHDGYKLSPEELKRKAKRNLRLLESESDKNPQPYVLYQIANSYHTLEEYELAAQYFYQALNAGKLEDGIVLTILQRLAEFEMNRTNFDKAKKLLDRGYAIEMNNPLINLLLSVYYMSMHDYSASVGYALKSWEFNSKSEFSSKLYAIINARKIIYQGLLSSLLAGGGESFGFFLNKLQTVERKSSSAVDNLINRKYNYSDWEAVSFLDEISVPFFIELFNKIEDKNFRKNIFKITAQKFPDNSEVLLHTGLAFSETGEFRKAKNYFTSALKCREKNPAALFYLAAIYLEEDNYPAITELIDSYREYFAKYPEAENLINHLEEKISLFGSIK